MMKELEEVSFLLSCGKTEHRRCLQLILAAGQSPTLQLILPLQSGASSLSCPTSTASSGAIHHSYPQLAHLNKGCQCTIEQLKILSQCTVCSECTYICEVNVASRAANGESNGIT